VSSLVDRAIDAAGLTDILASRRAGPLTTADVARLRGADLLALGALADRVRADEVGDEVLVDTLGDEALGCGDTPVVVFPPPEVELTGLELLREVAVARIAGARAARIRVDWTRCGLELAQVALGFGASELAGVIADKRGLPLAEDAKLGVLGKTSRLEAAGAVKRREIEAFVRRAGRTPRWVGAAPAAAPPGDAMREAT
jgi:2-iminoacetate synthase ThiH